MYSVKNLFNTTSLKKDKKQQSETEIDSHFLGMFYLYSFITFVMSIFEFFHSEIYVSLSTIGASAFSLLTAFCYKKFRLAKKGCEISFLIQISSILIYLLILGKTQGFSSIWFLIFPFVVMFLFKRTLGTILSCVMLLVLSLFFWAPIGNELLRYQYPESFKIRFIILYFFFYLVANFTENLRATTYNELQKTKETYLYLYRHDALTEVFNRYGFNEVVKELENKISVSGLTLMILDIDYFKNLNDEKGHSVGDAVLKELAKLLTETFKDNGIICRWGGEEFALFLNTCEDALTTANNLRIKIENYDFTSCAKDLFNTEQLGKIQLTVSIGVATSQKNCFPKINNLFSTADSNLFIAKNSGRNCVVCDDKKILFGNTKNKNLQNSLRTDTTLWDYQNIFDSFATTGLYLISEHEHKILFYNKRVKEIAPDIQLGMICNTIWPHSCENCPLNKIGEKQFFCTTDYDSPFGKEVDISATRIMWKGTIPAFIIRVWPKSVSSYEEINKNSIYNVLSTTYTIDNDFNITNYSDHIKEHFSKIQIGKKCYQTFFDNDEPCPDCPTKSKKNKKIIKIFDSDFIVDSLPIRFENKIVGNTIFFRFSNHGEPKKTALNNYGENQFDNVTNGFNRAGFIYAIEKLRENKIDLTNYAIIICDIQNFKAINELFGYEGGDNLLGEVYHSLTTSEWRPQISARKESDHFAFLVKKENIDLKKLPKILTINWKFQNKEILIHCRCGLYYIEDNSKDILTMLNCTRLTKNFITDNYVKPYAIFKESMLKTYINQTETLSNYDTAIENNEFQVFFQPVIDPKTKKIVSAEALTRWNHQNEFVPPDSFIPTIEKTGYISKLDNFVLDSVAKYLQNRVKNKLPYVPISVNLSRMDFYDSELIEKLLTIFQKTNLPKNSIRFEITETAYASLENSSAEIISKLRATGAKILLDDFGTGYSSFAMIQNFEFDFLKIDMNFTKQINSNKKVRNIIETIIEMCHKIGLKVVAEGVEKPVELSFLKNKQCDFIQGYYYSKPLNQEDFTKYLEKHI